MRCLDPPALSRFASGLGSSAEQAEAERHLAGCPRCAAQVAEAREAQAETRAAPPLASQAPTLPAPSPPGPLEADRLQRGASVGRYLILEPVGQGGMGVIYAAYDPELNRKVAIKLLRASPRDAGTAAEGQARLLREAQAMARVSHPNVIAVHDVGAFQDQVFVAMELVDGATLTFWLLERRRTWREVLDLLLAAGRGLAAAHAAGLVHRDFKPDNVLVSRDGRVRVTDFGLARLAHTAEPPRDEAPARRERPETLHRLLSPITQDGEVVGTPSYMAPEQHLGKPPGVRSDQFSFCAALYYALYLKRPFDPRELAEPAKARIQPPPREPRVPGWVKRPMLRGLALAPEDRFASLDELLARLSRPPTTLRRLSAAALLVAVLGYGVLAYRSAAERQAALCSGAGERLTGIWDAGVRRQVEAAFTATGAPYAAATLQGVTGALSAYAGAWTGMYTDACRATRIRGEQTEAVLALRMGCLERRLKGLEAFTALLARADAGVVQKATTAASSLSPIGDCADVEALSAPVPLPDSPEARAGLSRLASQIARAEALRRAGQYRQGLEGATPAVAEARRLGYPPLLADALCEQGWNQLHSGDAKSAEVSFIEAWRSAEVGRHDEAKVIAATGLLYALGNHQARSPEAQLWGSLGEASLARIGGHPELEMDLRHQLAASFYYAGQISPALVQEERALALADARHPMRARILSGLGAMYGERGDVARARQALEESVTLSERLLGPHHPESAFTRNNLAVFYSDQGEQERAHAQIARALATEEAALGPEHLQVGSILDTEATILIRQGRHAEALPKALRSLEVQELWLDPTHSDLATTLASIGVAYLETGRARDALPFLERGLTLKVRDPLQVAKLRFHLARALAETGRDPKRARALAGQAREAFLEQGRQGEVAQVEVFLAGQPR